MAFIDKFRRVWMGPFPFTETSIKQNAPQAPGVYQVLLKGQVVYIGISAEDTIRVRLQKHVKGHGNWALARRVSDAYEFVYFLCDGKTAKQIESFTTLNDKPPYNSKQEYLNYIPNITVH